MYLHIYTCEKLFSKIQSMKLALTLPAHSFFERRLLGLGKEFFTYGLFFKAGHIMLCFHGTVLNNLLFLLSIASQIMNVASVY